jgi:hypothetical protein
MFTVMMPPVPIAAVIPMMVFAYIGIAATAAVAWKAIAARKWRS